MKKWIHYSIAYLLISFAWIMTITGIFYGDVHWQIEGSLPFWDSFMTYFRPWSWGLGFIWLVWTVIYIFDMDK